MGTMPPDNLAAPRHQAEFGQLLPVILSPDRTPEGLLHVETCRTGNSGTSANGCWPKALNQAAIHRFPAVSPREVANKLQFLAKAYSVPTTAGQ